MYSNIINSEQINFKNKIKNILVYFRYSKRAIKSWRIRFNKVYLLNPNYKDSLIPDFESEYVMYWSKLSDRVNLATVRMCYHISGIKNIQIVPEEVFVKDIEPTLNYDQSVEFISNKSFYDFWFNSELFPKSNFHCIDGVFFDSNHEPIDKERLNALISDLKYPVIYKPNRYSSGGKNVFKIESASELESLLYKSSNFLVQDFINQHQFFNKFNEVGVNSLRVYVYRSVIDNEYYILNIALRMGKGGSLDNETSGGIVCFIKPNGELNGFAVDKFGQKYFVHPDTNILFDGIVPAFNVLKEKSLKIAKKVYFTRIIGLDAVYTRDEEWKFLEFNPLGHTIRFAQYAGHPFFLNFTDEVVNYCIDNHWAKNPQKLFK